MTPAQKAALPGIVSDMEGSRDRQKAETRFQRDVLQRAKELHLDAKAVRKVLQRRAEDPKKRQEFDDLVDEYEHALGDKKAALDAIEAGASINEAAKLHGVRRASLQALAGTETKKKGRHENQVSVPDHDPTTGEIHESAAPALPGASPPPTSGIACPAAVAADLHSAPDQSSREAGSNGMPSARPTEHGAGAEIDGAAIGDVNTPVREEVVPHLRAGDGSRPEPHDTAPAAPLHQAAAETVLLDGEPVVPATALPLPSVQALAGRREYDDLEPPDFLRRVPRRA